MRHLAKRGVNFRQRGHVIAADVDSVAHQADATIVEVCRVLEVSRSTYYAQRKGKPAQRTRRNIELDSEISALFQQHKGRYGSPRVYRALKAQNRRISRKKVAARMKSMGLIARTKKRFQRTSKSDSAHPVAPNLIERNFSVDAPNKAWVGDLTYIWTGQRWVYLAMLIDLYARNIVGWAVSSSCDEALARKALENAVARRKPAPGLIHHTDRGSTYTAHAYQARLKKLGFQVSMSRKGNCWDNAVAESTNGIVKRECIGDAIPHDLDDARRMLGQYIEIYYNHQRIHSTNGYVTPTQKEKEFLDNLSQPV